MKKKLVSAVLAALMLAAFAVPVLGAANTPTGTDSGIYNLNVTLSGAEVKPQVADAANGVYITAVNGFYAKAEKLYVSYTGAAEGYYLVLAQNSNAVPTADNIEYIDQESAGSSGVSFTVYPTSLENGKTYYIYIVGGSGGREQLASFDYYSGTSSAPYVLGDANGNGSVGADDALAVLQAVAHLRDLSGVNALAADVTGNGSIGADDALKILQAVAHIVDL